MAGLKKKKEKSGNPNIVLVIFLVLFIISNITLGVLYYYSIEEKENFRGQRTRAEAERKAEKLHADYFEMLWLDARTALGDKLGDDEIQNLNIYRDIFVADDFGKFKEEKTREAARKLMKENKAILETDANGKDYKSNFPALLADASKKAADLEGKANKETYEHAKTRKLLKDLTAQQDDLYASAMVRIGKEGAAYLAELKKSNDGFKAQFELNLKLTEDLNEEKNKYLKQAEEFEDKMNRMAKAMKDLKADRDEIAGLRAKGSGPAPTLTRGDTYPLLLNIAPGKPLWDQPVGKVTRVDLDLRQVVINLGSSHGAKPEVTFNLFGPNASGVAEKGMKGSIEIIKVLDTNSSLCRITSLYDAEGYEIALGAGTRGQILRETDVPVREGDLLFNMFWGTRVAIAGYVSVTGDPSDNPSEQNQQMTDFLALCRRSGMQVDAFVDLRDGQIKGNITSKTRYLILGDELATERKAPPPKMPAEDKDGEEKKDPPVKEPVPAVNAQRSEAVNKSIGMLRNDAKALGLLQISAEDFAVVSGYRKARNANSVQVSGFQPMLPYAGPAAVGGAMRAPPAGAPMPMPEEKKAPDDKMEKN